MALAHRCTYVENFTHDPRRLANKRELKMRPNRERRENRQDFCLRRVLEMKKQDTKAKVWRTKDMRMSAAAAEWLAQNPGENTKRVDTYSTAVHREEKPKARERKKSKA